MDWKTNSPIATKRDAFESQDGSHLQRLAMALHFEKVDWGKSSNKMKWNITNSISMITLATASSI